MKQGPSTFFFLAAYLVVSLASLRDPLTINLSPVDSSSVIQAIVADTTTDQNAALHVAYGPLLGFSTKNEKQKTTLMMYPNASLPFFGNGTKSYELETRGSVKLFSLSWPPMQAGCSGMRSTDSFCKFLVVLGAGDGDGYGGSLTVINVTNNEYGKVVCETEITSNLAIKFPFVSFTDRGLYFWNYSYIFGPRKNPELWSFDLRTCKTFNYGKPLGDKQLVWVARDPFPIAVRGSIGSTYKLSAAFCTLSDPSYVKTFVNLAITIDQNAPWKATPPPMTIESSAPAYRLGQFLFAVVDSVCASWPPGPNDNCMSYAYAQRLVTSDNLFSGITESYDLRTLNHTSGLVVGNVVRWQTIYDGIPAAGQGLIFLTTTPRGNYSPRATSLVFLNHGADFELYINSIVHLQGDPTTTLSQGPPVRVLASSATYDPQTKRMNYCAYVVNSEISAQQKQITRYFLDNQYPL